MLLCGYGWTAKEAPMDGPQIIKTLADVHAHQLFVDGVYVCPPPSLSLSLSLSFPGLRPPIL